MAHDAHISGAQPQLRPDLFGVALCVERQNHHGPLAVGQTRETACQAVKIEQWASFCSGRSQLVAVAFEEPLPTLHLPSQVRDHLAAGSKDKGREPFPVSDLRVTQPVERRQHHVLYQVICSRRIPEVSEPVETHTRREPAVQLGLGVAITGCEPARQVGVSGRDDAGSIRQGFISIPPPAHGECNETPVRYTSSSWRNSE